MNVNDPGFLIGVAAIISAIGGVLALRFSPTRKAKPVAAVIIPADTEQVETTYAWSNIVIAALQAELTAMREARVIDDEDHRRCTTALAGANTELTRMYRKHGNGG